MPNPRSGTMVQPQDLPRAIQEAKGGRTEYRTDRTAIIHCAIGKISFENNMLLGNMAALTDAITRDRPAALKGQYFRSAHLSSSMGPSVPMDLTALQALRPRISRVNWTHNRITNAGDSGPFGIMARPPAEARR